MPSYSEGVKIVIPISEPVANLIRGKIASIQKIVTK